MHNFTDGNTFAESVRRGGQEGVRVGRQTVSGALRAGGRAGRGGGRGAGAVAVRARAARPDRRATALPGIVLYNMYR